MQTLYYAMGSHCWGIGKTQEEAIKLAKPNWCYHPKVKRPKPEHFTVFKLERQSDEPITVTISDIDGGFSYPKDVTVTEVQTSTVLGRA